MLTSIFAFLASPVTELIGIGRDYLKGRREIKQAKVETEVAIEKAKAVSAVKIAENAQQADIEWDKLMAERSDKTWRDEYITILMSIPAILAFIPWTQDIAIKGFEILSQTPEWYRYTLGVVVAAAFGFRKVADVIGSSKGK